MWLFWVIFVSILVTGGENLSRNGSSLFQVVEPGKLDKESTVASGHSGWDQESLANTARQLSLLGNILLSY